MTKPQNGFRLCLGDVTPNNINQLKKLNLVLFPIRYTQKYYQDVLESAEFSKFALFNDVPVGAIGCRLEQTEESKRIYLMTCGILAPYRKMGLGRLLMEHLINESKNNQIESIYLHVQMTNKEAKSFYEKFGFQEKEVIENYYKNADEPRAWLLELSINSA